MNTSCKALLSATVIPLFFVCGVLQAQTGATATQPVKIKEIKPAQTREAPQKLYPENSRLIERRGLIVIYEMDILGEQNYKPWFRSAFVSSTDKEVFILLENEVLERLEDNAGRGRAPVEVTGTLAQYKGRNYLLLTRASIARQEAPSGRGSGLGRMNMPKPQK